MKSYSIVRRKKINIDFYKKKENKTKKENKKENKKRKQKNENKKRTN